jgi:hypothetical protein
MFSIMVLSPTPCLALVVSNEGSYAYKAADNVIVYVSSFSQVALEDATAKESETGGSSGSPK